MRNVVSGILGWGAVIHMLEDRARGGGARPLRIRPRRGGERQSWRPATSSLWITAGWGDSSPPSSAWNLPENRRDRTREHPPGPPPGPAARIQPALQGCQGVTEIITNYR